MFRPNAPAAREAAVEFPLAEGQLRAQIWASLLREQIWFSLPKFVPAVVEMLFARTDPPIQSGRKPEDDRELDWSGYLQTPKAQEDGTRRTLRDFV